MSFNDYGIIDFTASAAPKLKAAPKIKDVHPFGSNILIELLNDQELTSNQIMVTKGTGGTNGPPQAYVLEVGAAVTIPEVRDLVGKRVIVNGSGINVPDYDGHNRLRLLVEYQSIKAVIEEITDAQS